MGCGTELHHQDHRVLAASLEKVKPQAAEVTAYASFHGPTCTVTRLTLAPGQMVIQYTFETPVDEFHVKKHLVSARTMNLDPGADKATNRMNLFVAEEDRVIIEDVDPAIYPETNTKELLVPADEQIAIYREMIAEWEARRLAHRHPEGCRRSRSHRLRGALSGTPRGGQLDAGLNADAPGQRKRKSQSRRLNAPIGVRHQIATSYKVSDTSGHAPGQRSRKSQGSRLNKADGDRLQRCLSPNQWGQGLSGV